MKRSRPVSSGAIRLSSPDGEERRNHYSSYEFSTSPDLRENNNNATLVGAAIVRSIASFLTLSDAASLHSQGQRGGAQDSWAVGVALDHNDEDSNDSWSCLSTPPTPALVQVSPGATPSMVSIVFDEESLERVLQERRRSWAQEKLAAAVFSHPLSLRSFCLEAYMAAAERLRSYAAKQRAPEEGLDIDDEECYENCTSGMLLDMAVNIVFHNVPLSVLIHVLDAVVGTSWQTTVAGLTLTASSVQTLLQALGSCLCVVWDTIANFNPFQLLEAIISLQFNAMGKTSEVLVSGIQSVATGVESASSIALNRLSGANLVVVSAATLTSSSKGEKSKMPQMMMSHHHPPTSLLLNQQKLLRKMSHINEAARVVAYRESDDDTGGLTRHAMTRTRRMMHYSVSLRPFVATVEVNANLGDLKSCAFEKKTTATDRTDVSRPTEASASLTAAPLDVNGSCFVTDDVSQAAFDEDPRRPCVSPQEAIEDDTSSPVICSPQSFPPTPNHRQRVLAQSSQFADDVVFLARDRLRIFNSLESENERTREMARALSEGKRLAVFDGNNQGGGIQLTCGQHIATKVGNLHYASTRSMVPVLRNCHVYFEITVLPHFYYEQQQQPVVTLSIGVATPEMPPNTLVGAWQGSVGLCTTGQILAAGQWCSPADPSKSAYGHGATVGCLVLIDDASEYETWDGVMVHASVTFSINGAVVPPPASLHPLTPAPGAGPLLHQQQLVMAPSPLLGTQTVVVPASEELYPTVSLQTPATAVICRFSQEDVIAESKASIGAPEHVSVYAVDGSVIFDGINPLSPKADSSGRNRIR